MKTIIVTVPGMIEAHDWAALAELSEVEYIERAHVTEDELSTLCLSVDYLMLNYDVVRTLGATFYTSDGAHHLRGISVDITGMDWASPHLAQENNILLTYTPYYSTESVAEATVGEVFLHAKERHNAYIDQLHGEVAQERKGIDLAGKTAGIVGMGHIGTRVAEMLGGIGMRVVAWNRTKKSLPVPAVDLDRLFAESAIVCICAKTVTAGPEANVGMIDAELLDKSRPGLILVNLSGYQLVDTDKVRELLSSGQLRGYSVTANDDTKALGYANNYGFSFAPANAWFSDESLQMLREIWVGNVVNMIKGSPTNIYSD